MELHGALSHRPGTAGGVRSSDTLDESSGVRRPRYAERQHRRLARPNPYHPISAAVAVASSGGTLELGLATDAQV
jgi:hypothetical protein